MTTIYIEDIASHVGEEVTVRGWVHNKRSSGKLRFLIVRDGTGYLLVRDVGADRVADLRETGVAERRSIGEGRRRDAGGGRWAGSATDHSEEGDE